ncbi:MAG: transcriptional repressor NrdR [Elusimicrobia bacterium]|nr:transcriptional repressor NrdR [Elusimicrobiota bacterium]MBD3411871.1 transcriptional repressor NrdR [Elusimicrobiota bacterium]
MNCPFCKQEKDRVIDSRPLGKSSVIRRRRLCLSCNRRFTTYERLEQMPLMVIKKDGSRKPFDRNKVRQGIMRACQKRPISGDQIEKIVTEIDLKLQEYLLEIPSDKIGELVLDQLIDLDPVAYVRFASVYRRFDSIDMFLKEFKKLRNSRYRKKIRKDHLERQLINASVH